jgi:hypothetical protein
VLLPFIYSLNTSSPDVNNDSLETKMPINYSQLKSELQNDPNSYGYAPFMTSGNDTQLANMLNEVRGSISVFIPVSLTQIVNCISVLAEWNALTALQLQRLQFIAVNGYIDTASLAMRTVVTDIFSAASQTTKNNLAAAAQRTGSRAEQLFGTGTSITHEDIVKARSA